MKDWLQKFCRDVWGDKPEAAYAARIIDGGVDGFIARHGAPKDEVEHKHWLEQGLWFAYDNKVPEGGGSDEDKRVAVLEHLEKVHRKSVD